MIKACFYVSYIHIKYTRDIYDRSQMGQESISMISFLLKCGAEVKGWYHEVMSPGLLHGNQWDLRDTKSRLGALRWRYQKQDHKDQWTLWKMIPLPFHFLSNFLPSSFYRLSMFFPYALRVKEGDSSHRDTYSYAMWENADSRGPKISDMMTLSSWLDG